MIAQPKLFRQKYREARESGLVTNLECIGLVSADIDSPSLPPNVLLAEEELRKNGIGRGATHIFEVGFQFGGIPKSPGYMIIYGEGYKLKKD